MLGRQRNTIVTPRDTSNSPILVNHFFPESVSGGRIDTSAKSTSTCAVPQCFYTWDQPSPHPHGSHPIRKTIANALKNTDGEREKNLQVTKKK